jgi:hypothetical protein
MFETTLTFDPMLTVWELGYGENWEGAANFEPWSIEKTLDRAIELNLLKPSQRDKVRTTCLSEGEYFSGLEGQASWTIGQNEDFECPSPFPDQPIWALIQLNSTTNGYDPTSKVAPTIDEEEWKELKKERRVIHSNLTLPEILKIALPLSE